MKDVQHFYPHPSKVKRPDGAVNVRMVGLVRVQKAVVERIMARSGEPLPERDHEVWWCQLARYNDSLGANLAELPKYGWQKKTTMKLNRRRL